MTTKWVYGFGDGKAEGAAGMKNLLGGKGANLAEMCKLGVPVPPGFTITTEVCTGFYQNHDRAYPDGAEGRSGQTPSTGSADQGGGRLRRPENRCWCRCAQARACPCRA
jgi:phosphoenolpyruvate synthase/pyruvate phosphate dikinase